MKSKNDIKRQKAALLGMPYGTAEKHLRKALILELASQCGKNLCHQCRTEIQSPSELAIVHLQDWTEDPARFWDLGNIALSHVSCVAGNRDTQHEVKVKHVQIIVEDTNGNLLQGITHKKQIYVAGKSGQQYRVRLNNLTNKRVMVVMTVDGRNVLTGQPGSYLDRGYVLEPRSSNVIEGWRQTNDKVAAFVLGKSEDSYSASLGSPENVGSIGVAVFEEKEKPLWLGDPNTFSIMPLVHRNIGGNSGSPRYDGSMYGSVLRSVTTAQLNSHGNTGGVAAMADTRSQDLGTQYGQTIESRVTTTSFERKSSEPCEVHQIRYDSIPALVKAGIWKNRKPEGPAAFPQEPQVSEGYCPPPPRR
jgi:hypothetical protein